MSERISCGSWDSPRCASPSRGAGWRRLRECHASRCAHPADGSDALIAGGCRGGCGHRVASRGTFGVSFDALRSSTMIALLRQILTPSENSLICMRDVRTGKPRHAHWFPWLMLVWTFWIFATPVLFTGTEFQNWMWPTFTSFALFLVMFHRVYYRDRTQVVWNAIGIAVLGFVVTPFNPGAQGYLISACAFLAFHGTSREAARNMI